MRVVAAMAGLLLLAGPALAQLPDALGPQIRLQEVSRFAGGIYVDVTYHVGPAAIPLSSTTHVHLDVNATDSPRLFAWVEPSDLTFNMSGPGPDGSDATQRVVVAWSWAPYSSAAKPAATLHAAASGNGNIQPTEANLTLDLRWAPASSSSPAPPAPAPSPPLMTRQLPRQAVPATPATPLVILGIAFLAWAAASRPPRKGITAS